MIIVTNIDSGLGVVVVVELGGGDAELDEVGAHEVDGEVELDEVEVLVFEDETDVGLTGAAGLFVEVGVACVTLTVSISVVDSTTVVGSGSGGTVEPPSTLTTAYDFARCMSSRGF